MGRAALLAACWLGAAAGAFAQATPREAAERWLERRPFTEQLASDAEEAAAAQAAFVERLTASLGRPVGYKAALTNPAAQRRFQIDQPVLGVLLDGMLRPDGSAWPADFAAVPAIEGDLLVRVGNAAINDAQEDLDLLAGLDAAIPFLELADLGWPPELQPSAASLVAANAGARAGCYGAAIPLQPTPEALERLAAVTVRLVDGTGAERATGEARSLLGHPIQAVRWIRDAVHARGDRLKPGDLLSLGSMTPLLPLRPDERWTAVYRGLDAATNAAVSCSILPAAAPP